ncbi:MAG: hypothetical protein ACLRSW_05020 [Christensenellaceae bacterium]
MISSKLKVYDNAIFDAENLLDISEEQENPKIKFVILITLRRSSLTECVKASEAQSQIVKSSSTMPSGKYLHNFGGAPEQSKDAAMIEDVGGSGDIINTADTVLLVHRVTEISKSGRRVLRLKEGNPALNTQTLSKRKDRELARRQYGRVYFDPRPKRFLNRRDEVIRYGWDVSPTAECRSTK